MSHSFSLEAILAIARNNAIGLDGKLPWHLPVELKLFKEVTMHHALIMGRKTFESLPLCSVVPSSGSQLGNKTYTDATLQLISNMVHYFDITTSQTFQE